MLIKIGLAIGATHTKLPCCLIRINDQVMFDGTISKSGNLEFDFRSTKSNMLEIVHYNKNNEDTIVHEDKIVEDLFIELKSIEIDGVPVDEILLYQSKFYVDWPANIVNEHIRDNKQLPECIANNLYFGFNGRYVFEFAGDSDKRYYDQFWTNEEQAHSNQTVILDGKEVFKKFGDFRDINAETELTIYDLECIIDNEVE